MKIITISEHFSLWLKQDDLDFFDSYLWVDNPLSIDPFLIKRSSNEIERKLYLRFESYFDHVLKHLLKLKLWEDSSELRSLVYFREPKQINLWYTVNGNGWKWPWKEFWDLMLKFLRSSVVSKVFEKEIQTKNGFNPNVLRIFVDKLWPDWISDFSAWLIMDYLIEFTQKQCKKHNIPLTNLPSPAIFDFTEGEWYNSYFDLPEDPSNPWEPIIFLPKNILRYLEDNFDNQVKSKVVWFLRQDEDLKQKFARMIDKSISDISIWEVRRALTWEKEVFKRLILEIESERWDGYDFFVDALELSSYQTHKEEVISANISLMEVTNGEELFKLAKRFLKFLTEEYEGRDWWRNAWNDEKECTEPTFWRFIRGLGNAFFWPYKDITFLPEVWSGNGFLDYILIYKSHRISIELKKLGNISKKWEKNLPSYIHWLTEQLPDYIKNNSSEYWIYLTLQHHRKDDSKTKELNRYVSWVERALKKDNPNFKSLFYYNIDVCKEGKSTSSNK